MVYRRPFSIVLEESLEGSTLGGETVEGPLEEAELVEAVEEAGELQAEINQDSADVDEALEEAEALSEQAVATDEVLAQTADEEGATADEGSAITEEQVVTAEESFKWSLAKLGAASGYSKVVEVSRESAAGAKTRRERLKICNEGVKEFLGKLIQNIINFAKKIASRVILFVKKHYHAFQNYKKQWNKASKRVKDLKESDVNKEEFMKALASTPSIEISQVVESSSIAPLVEVIKNVSKKSSVIEAGIASLGEVASRLIKESEVDRSKASEIATAATQDAAMKVVGSEFAKAINTLVTSGVLALSSNGESEIRGVEMIAGTGRSYIGFKDGKVVKGTLDFASDYREVVSKRNVSISSLIKSVNDAKKAVEDGAEDIKKAGDNVVKAQKKVEKELKSRLESAEKAAQGFGAAMAIQGIKAVGIDLSMTMFNLYIASIKTSIKVASLLGGYGKKDKKDDDDE